MPESFRSKLERWKFNLFPAYRGTGARVDYIGEDWREVRVSLPLSWRTRNLVGTIFGGSMYGAVDPMYMVMLIRNLGKDYIVWDKAAAIRFRKPGRPRLYARFLLAQEELDAIRAELCQRESIDRVYRVDLTDASGTVHATARENYLHPPEVKRSEHNLLPGGYSPQRPATTTSRIRDGDAGRESRYPAKTRGIRW